MHVGHLKVELRELRLTVAAQVFIPLTVGGGVRNVQDVRRLLNAGADKVSINTAAVQNPGLVEEAAGRFGSQCIVVAVDARRGKGGRRALKGSIRAGRSVGVPVFRLIPYATLHQRFDWRPLAAAAQASIPREVMREYERLAAAAAVGERRS